MTPNPLDPAVAPFDKTNPLEGAAAPLGPTLWGLATGESAGNIFVENEATAACSGVLPGGATHSILLPSGHLQLAKQSHANVAVVLPRGAPGPRPWLPPRQVRAVRMLLAGNRICDVAKALGVCRHTVSRWMKHPYFRAEVRGQAATIQPLGGKGTRPKA